MNRLTSKYLVHLAFAALPFTLACDVGDDLAVADVDVSGSASGASSDVLVVHFETRGNQTMAETNVEPDVEPVPDIAREDAASEGLASEDASETTTLDLTGQRWVVSGGQLVVSTGEELRGLDGEATLTKVGTKDDGLFVAMKALAIVPSEIQALAGQEVKVFDREREVCVARVVADFALTAELVHLPAQWLSEEEAEVVVHTAAEVFESGSVAITASLEPLIGDCSKGLWAAPLAAPTPRLYREVALDNKLMNRARTAFRQTQAWRDAQQAMATFFNDPESNARLAKQRWDRLPNTQWTTKLYRTQDGHELIAMSADSWDGCGSEGQRVVSLFDVQRNGKTVELVERTSLHGANLPTGFVDLEADGTLELFTSLPRFGTTIERWHGDRAAPSDTNDWQDLRYEPVHSYEVNDATIYGCSC